jgi:hypothetical protein
VSTLLTIILKVCLAALLLLVVIAALRSRRTRHHDISVSEIHPDLAAGEELLQDVLSENRRADAGGVNTTSTRQ